jgi:hypothetical protein
MMEDDRAALVVRTAGATSAVLFVLQRIPETLTWDLWAVAMALFLTTFVLGPFVGLLAVFVWDHVVERLGGRRSLALVLVCAALCGVAWLRRVASADEARDAIRACREASKQGEGEENPMLCQYREVWRTYLPESDLDDDGEFRGYK